MGNPFLDLAFLSAWAAVFEYALLRCWSGRCQAGVLVVFGGIISGVVWAILWAAFGLGIDTIKEHIKHPENPYNSPLGASPAGEIVLLLLVAVISCAIALIASALTAVIYRKLQRKT